MKRRKITVELTEAQFNALSGIYGRGEYDAECEAGDDGMAWLRKDLRLAERAWTKIAGAWYRGERRARE